MNPQTNHNNVNVQQPPSGIGLDDIYFTIFRHKKILLACLCMGIIGALIVRATTKPMFGSGTKLMVRYVVQTTEVNPVNQGASIIQPDGAGESIMSSETEMLTSMDLSEEVAKIVGPEKILAKIDGGSNLLSAARVVNGGISAFSQHRSDVLLVFYFHPDSEIVRPVLDALIQAYLRKHREVHQGMVFGQDYYSDELVSLRRKLTDTEEELRKALTDAKVISITEAKKTINTQTEKLNSELYAAKAELYGRRAALGENVEAKSDTNNASLLSIPADKLEYYATVLSGLEALAKRERELLVQGLTEAHPSITTVRESIANLKKTRADLEQEYPGIALSENSSSGVDLSVERARIRSLAAKVEGYENLLSNLQDKALNLLMIEPKIAELERQRDQEAKNLEYVQSSLDKARADEIGGNKVTGINVLEKPTPPTPNNKRMRKMMVMVFGAFVALGIGIAAVIDFVIDRTIKRSVDVKRHMRLPFFLAIPNTCWNGKLRLPRLAFNKLPRNGKSHRGDVADDAVTTVMPPWDPEHHLRMYTEGLRERLITYFEVNGINHKPKLVGVTSCGEGAGVTTLASGVAAALSKTGDGNVLLVDMNGGNGATHSFYKGKPGCGLADVLEPESRADAQVQENLYLVSMRPSGSPDSEGEDEASAKLLPSRFNKIMPQLKASDYDYVIFDMPPVTPTSVTPRMATNMDMVLLVLESERTGQQVAAQAGTLLAEARVNAAVVLNKCRQHVPALLSQGL